MNYAHLILLVAIFSGSASAEDVVRRVADRRTFPILAHGGECTLCSVVSAFTYKEPLKYETLVDTGQKLSLEECPPETVLARMQMALTRGISSAVLETVEDGRSKDVYRKLYGGDLKESVAQRSKMVLELTNGFEFGDYVGIAFRMTATGVAPFTWYEVLKHTDKGWRITSDIPVGGFMMTLLAAAKEGASRYPQVNRFEGMTFFKVSPDAEFTPNSRPDNSIGNDVLVGVRLSQTNRVEVSDSDVPGDPVLHFLHQVIQFYRSGLPDADLKRYWKIREGLSLPKSPFGWRGEHPSGTSYGFLLDDDFNVALIGTHDNWRDFCLVTNADPKIVADFTEPHRQNTCRLFTDQKNLRGPIAGLLRNP